MLRLIVLTCLLAAAAAQQRFYCDTASPVTVRDEDFYLVTRRPTEAGYATGLSCEFNAESNTGGYFVEIQSFHVSTAVFTISSGGRVLFRGSSIKAHQSSFTTPSKSLQVHFDAAGDHSNSEGVTIRVRAMDLNGCPPGWTYLYGNCFGTSTATGRLNFRDAQMACNSMRSNLLQLPTSYVGTIGNFVRQLPYNLRSFYTWIGLTDRTSAGQFRHYWLNGYRQTSTSEISCVSGGSYILCNPWERCGTIYDKSYSYAIYMDDCTDRNAYACSMPPGGTNIYYAVPGTDWVLPVPTYSYTGWIWGVTVACILVVSLAVGGIYAAMRHSVVRRTAGATSVVVSAGRVSAAPPIGSYPMQPTAGLYPQLPPQYPPPMPHYSGAPPPAYAAAVGGHGNAGYAK